MRPCNLARYMQLEVELLSPQHANKLFQSDDRKVDQGNERFNASLQHFTFFKFVISNLKSITQEN